MLLTKRGITAIIAMQGMPLPGVKPLKRKKPRPVTRDATQSVSSFVQVELTSEEGLSSRVSWCWLEFAVP